MYTMFAWVRFSVKCAVLLTVAAIFLYLSISFINAASITQYSDTISDSAPSESANHTVQFTITDAVPAGGFVEITPQAGSFTIPAATLSVRNVDLYVSTSSGFQIRSATGTVSSTTDGVTVTGGTSGNVRVDLNTSLGIPAGAIVRLVIGSNTVGATTTDTGITNPSATNSYTINIETGTGTSSTSYQAVIAIIDSIAVGPADTTEVIPPVRFNGAPSGELSGTVQNVEVSLETDEFSTCRYSTASSTAYFSMGSAFSQTFVTVHTLEIPVAINTSYEFYVRCIDDEGNFNIDDYLISFSIPEFPDGVPGDTGNAEEEGDAGSGDNTGDGSGTATAGGSGSGGGSGGGGSSGGSGSDDDNGDDAGAGVGNGGGFSGSGPYQSGDGRVIINGYAFPNSTVVVLVDGAIAEQDSTEVDGDFSITIDDIARGTYTFGVYAIDERGTKSSTFSTSFLVTGARGSTLSNINVMPSILVEPDPIDPGNIVTFSGYSIPDAAVTIENQNDTSSISIKTFTSTSDSDGFWTYDVSTAGFKTGTYKVRAKAKQTGGVFTNYSEYTFYGVGQEAAVPFSSDLNKDGSVNLIDFSILLFWWNSDGGASDPPADINRDGNVTLTDFSIMIFNWTG